MGTKRIALLWTLVASAACSKAPDVGQSCPTGMIATANGCLPEGNNGPVPDAGIGQNDNDASGSPDAGPKVQDAGVAADAADGKDADIGTDAMAPDTGIVTVDMTGVWAMQLTNSETITNATLGTANVNVRVLSMVTATQQAEQVNFTMQICAVTSGAFQGYTTTYPAAAIGAFAMTQQSATFASPQQVGSTLTPAQIVLVLGWQPTGDPATDALPTDPADPRLVDADNDTNPGVTLNVAGPTTGQIYVVNRAIYNVSGTAKDVNTIGSTKSEAQRAQNVVGASDAILAAAASSTITPNAAGTQTFRMARLVTVAHTCAAIISNRATLFP
jgi:hypothetical protein